MIYPFALMIATKILLHFLVENMQGERMHIIFSY